MRRDRRPSETVEIKQLYVPMEEWDIDGLDGKRYMTKKGGGNRVYVPPILNKAILTDSSKTLYITEGEKKSAKATQEGFPCIALAGVWSWKRKVHGKSLTIPDFDYIEWRNRIVVVVFDSDVVEKPQVARAEHDLVEEADSANSANSAKGADADAPWGLRSLSTSSTHQHSPPTCSRAG